MGWLVMTFVLLCAAIVQSLLPSFICLGQSRPPLLLAVVLYYALRREDDITLVAGLQAGFFQDILDKGPLGYSALIFCIIGWTAGRFRRVVVVESLITQVFFGFIAGGVVVLGGYLMLRGTEFTGCRPSWVLVKMFGVSILSMICTPVVFLMISKLDRLLGNIEVKEEDILDDFEYGS